MFITLFLFDAKYTQASFTSNVNATVKISVCGNGIIEGGEDCEGVDLNSQSCTTLGFDAGTLSCDIACSFDTTDCLTPTPIPSPTATPIPTATLTPTLTPTPTSAPSNVSTTSTSNPTSQTTSTPTPNPSPAGSLLQIPVAVVTPMLPLPILSFDTDGNGKLETTEIYFVVKDWVEQWREDYDFSQKTPKKQKKCDINQDQRCNLFDFSILMYYVER
ncbi:MAG: hypothetical protein UU73_C0001G0008 [Candidatus Daviesbacteria bacterium GW2011_GWA1_41_61]|uniref:EF-hand domain-containing protein n=1 Tax=Candidatus Daviesbacteria bacterium GW2011_GWA2_40_9 TaxID=1618424 RepID=A0A0G0U1B2_9BACT|nr:MAG: hypothetical protein UU26_C0002G0094 [Candidatus Daviesbacteria bacterium GW2011_GWC1_40_9]KKR82899.1 MAG: hypothetical protein UU29_C0008G0008 [Candidatus Daviesbacteria bacterium GW2011_GWA2_40_9]KKR92827.1 MAG: hypothetical protein UU44_C0004G0009 [Candidatus Daviesbacteria bacterium GW2011_GWB1_41_15]KKS15371.1 MAG: hypothetical protein UU73_C0001G0008 [Candidatus Daviesbacteria bacterium GW2011_GWA1_41_61]